MKSTRSTQIDLEVPQFKIVGRPNDFAFLNNWKLILFFFSLNRWQLGTAEWRTKCHKSSRRNHEDGKNNYAEIIRHNTCLSWWAYNHNFSYRKKGQCSTLSNRASKSVPYNGPWSSKICWFRLSKSQVSSKSHVSHKNSYLSRTFF